MLADLDRDQLHLGALLPPPGQLRHRGAVRGVPGSRLHGMAPLEGLARRVVLTGSECTGKTTLIADLARHYDALWVPEYARSYAAGKGAPLASGDVEPTAQGQIAGQDAAPLWPRPLTLLETQLLR